MASSDSSEEDDNKYNTVVIDNGSSTIKASFGGSDTPRSVFPSVVGYPRNGITHDINRSFYIGEEAVTKRGVLRLKYPIQYGCITDWDNMEKVGSFVISSIESQIDNGYSNNGDNDNDDGDRGDAAA